MMHLGRTPFMLANSSSYLILKIHTQLQLTECYANRSCTPWELPYLQNIQISARQS